MFLNTQFTSTRRAFCKYIGAAAASIFVGEANTFSVHAASHQEGQSRQSPGAGINVLLVHGAWVNASSWISVIPLLQAQGYNVLAVQNALTSFKEDVQFTRQALASFSGPTILVGHSYGGAVITNAGTGAPNLHSLVYIAAVAPDEGERFMARRIGATTRQSASSHASPVSHPRAVFEIIVAAAQGAHKHQVKPSDKRAGI